MGSFDSDEGTYMQRIAENEFKEFDEVSELFYEMVDSLHRLGDIDFLDIVKIDDMKSSKQSKIIKHIYEPNNILKIISSLDKINKNMKGLKVLLLDFLKDIDRINITDPEKKKERMENKDTRSKLMDIFVPLIMLIEGNVKDKEDDKELNDSLDELNEAVESLEKTISDSEKEDIFRSRPRIPRNIEEPQNQTIETFSYFRTNPIDRLNEN